MSSANCLPRCPHRVATANFKIALGILLVSFVSFTTATESLYGRELLDFRLVDPASHMQPWPDDKSDILIETPAVVRIATKWRTNLTGSSRTKKEPSKEKMEAKPAPSQPVPPLEEVPEAEKDIKPELPKELEVQKTNPPPVLKIAPKTLAVETPTQPEPSRPEPKELPPVEAEPVQSTTVEPQTTVVEKIEAPQLQPTELQEAKPTPESKPYNCYQAPPLTGLTTSIALPGGELPTNAAALCAEQNPPISDRRICGGWNCTNYHWSATCMHHRPLYFEEINAERYGYTVSYAFQPVISAARFFAAIPALPYKMVVERPRECIYTLGHYRPGSCAPRRCNSPGWSFGASAFETGAIAGLILLIP